MGALVHPTACGGFSYLGKETDVSFGTAFLLSALNYQAALWVPFQCFCYQLCLVFLSAPSSDFLSVNGFPLCQNEAAIWASIVGIQLFKISFFLSGLVEIHQVLII